MEVNKLLAVSYRLLACGNVLDNEWAFQNECVTGNRKCAAQAIVKKQRIHSLALAAFLLCLWLVKTTDAVPCYRA